MIATKARFPLKSDNPNYVGLSRRHLIESCDASLKRLQTDFIDLYQVWSYNLSWFVCSSALCHWKVMFCDCGSSWISSVLQTTLIISNSKDSLKHFEISVPRHISVAEAREKNRTTTFNK